jgi:hypothetical protein
MAPCENDGLSWFAACYEQCREGKTEIAPTATAFQPTVQRNGDRQEQVADTQGPINSKLTEPTAAGRWVVCSGCQQKRQLLLAV